MADERVAMKVSSFHAVLPFAATSATRPVLVVESDADQRRRVVTQLSNWGYSPLAAGSAEGLARQNLLQLCGNSVG